MPKKTSQEKAPSDLSKLGVLIENSSNNPDHDAKAEKIRRKQESKKRAIELPVELGDETASLKINKGAKLVISEDYRRDTEKDDLYVVEDIDFTKNWIKLGVYSGGEKVDEERININTHTEKSEGENLGDSLDEFVQSGVVDLVDTYYRFVKKEEVVIKKDADVNLDKISNLNEDADATTRKKTSVNKNTERVSKKEEVDEANEQYPDEGTDFVLNSVKMTIFKYDFKNEKVSILVTDNANSIYNKKETYSLNDLEKMLKESKSQGKENRSGRQENRSENRNLPENRFLTLLVEGKERKCLIAIIQNKLDEGIVVHDNESNERVLATYETIRKSYGDDFNKKIFSFINRLKNTDSKLVVPKLGEDLDFSKSKDVERYNLEMTEEEKADPVIFLKRLFSTLGYKKENSHPNFQKRVGWKNTIGKYGDRKLYTVKSINGDKITFTVVNERNMNKTSEVVYTNDEFIKLLSQDEKDKAEARNKKDAAVATGTKIEIPKANKSEVKPATTKTPENKKDNTQEKEESYDTGLFKFAFENPDELAGQDLEDHIFYANNYFKLLKDEEKKRQFGVYLQLLQARKTILDAAKKNKNKLSPTAAFSPKTKQGIELEISKLSKTIESAKDDTEKEIIRKNMNDLFADLSRIESESKESRMKKSFEIFENSKLGFAEKAKAIMDLGFDSLVLHGNPMYDESGIQYYIDKDGSEPSKVDKGTILTTERTETPAVKTGLDMDERLTLEFFYHSKFAKGFGPNIHNNTEIVPKGTQTQSTEAGVYVHFDTGGKQGFRIEKKGDQIHIYFDNHGEDKGKVLSAAESYYKWARQVGALEKPNPETEKFNAKLLDYVGKVDNAITPETVEFIHEIYPRTLIGLQKNMRLDDVIPLIKKGYGPYDIISNEDLNTEVKLLNPKLVNKKDKEGKDVLDASGKKVTKLKTKESLRTISKTIEIKINMTSRNMDNVYKDQLRGGIKGSTKELGRLAYHDNETHFYDPFLVARTIGFDTYIRHEKKNGGLYINSTKDLTKLKKHLEKEGIADRIQLVRNNMIFIKLKKDVTDEALYKALDIKRDKNKHLGKDIEKIKAEKAEKENRIKEIRARLNKIKEERDIINKK